MVVAILKDEKTNHDPDSSFWINKTIQIKHATGDVEYIVVLAADSCCAYI